MVRVSLQSGWERASDDLLENGRVDALRRVGFLPDLDLVSSLVVGELSALVVALVLSASLHHLAPDARFDLRRVGDGVGREDLHHV